MDAYDLQMDKYRAEQRFREEVKEEVRLLYTSKMKSICKKLCKASEDRTHCVSCLRTMKEIVLAGTSRTSEIIECGNRKSDRDLCQVQREYDSY